jgi:ankyrin repeat protein
LSSFLFLTVLIGFDFCVIDLQQEKQEAPAPAQAATGTANCPPLPATFQNGLRYEFVHPSCPSTDEERMNNIDHQLFHAAQENNVTEVLRLLSVGADVNVKNRFGWTPLHWASNDGHSQVVIKLLQNGADIEAKDNYGLTPLHWACMRGHLHAVEALVSGGANLLAGNINGRLLISKAVINGKSEVSKYLLQQMYATTSRLPLHELLEDLTWIGDPYSTRVRVPPLRAALHRYVLGTNDVVEILEYLVDRNPELLSSRGQDGSLPLHVACRRGVSFPIVESLVNYCKASVKSVTSEGDLPLFLACERPEPSLDTIFILVKLYPDLVYR